MSFICIANRSVRLPPASVQFLRSYFINLTKEDSQTTSIMLLTKFLYSCLVTLSWLAIGEAIPYDDKALAGDTKRNQPKSFDLFKRAKSCGGTDTAECENAWASLPEACDVLITNELAD
jgi:hypothetical protein